MERMNKTFTTGEIFRLGLLKNHTGKPYQHKATVARIVQRLAPAKVQTPWGMGYAITQKEIDRFNAQWE